MADDANARRDRDGHVEASTSRSRTTVLPAETIMKPIAPLRPEPSPSGDADWLAMIMTAVTAAVYLGLYVLVRSDFIADQAVILILVIGTPLAAVFIALLAGEQPDGRTGIREVPPPSDLYTVWPTELGDLRDLLRESKGPLSSRQPPPDARQ
jgi:hypothetical protein